MLLGLPLGLRLVVWGLQSLYEKRMGIAPAMPKASFPPRYKPQGAYIIDRMRGLSQTFFPPNIVSDGLNVAPVQDDVKLNEGNGCEF